MKVRLSWFSTAILSTTLLGCVAYVPADLETVPLGSSVRAHLSPEGAESFSERSGMSRETLNGTITERRAGSVMFLVRSVLGSQNGATLDNLYQQVDVPKADVVQIERKKIHAAKTAAVAAGGLALAGYTLYQALKSEPGTFTPLPPDGPADNIRVPFLMVKFFLPR